MKRRWIAAIVCVVAFLGDGSLRGWAQDPVRPLQRSDGRLVLTNLAVATPGVGRVSPALRTSADRLERLVGDISDTHGVDPMLTRAVIEIESGFSQNAVSPVGALGLMQLMPATGRRFGVRNFFDPAENIEGGVRYLKFLLDKFGDNLDLALAAYNSGENRVERLGRIPAIPETQNYVRKVREAYEETGGPWTVSVRSVDPRILAQAAVQIHQSVNDRGVRQFSTVGPRR